MKTALIIAFAVLAIVRLIPIVVHITDWIVAALRWLLTSLRLMAVASIAGVVSLPMLFLPADVPERERPWSPLNLDGESGLFDRWKVRAMALDPGICQIAIRASKARALLMEDREYSENCHIRSRVRLTGLSRAAMSPVETRCPIAARLYLWERQVVQPAAEKLLGSPVTKVIHFSSYSCRRMRTSRGTSGRMSQHATANAFDIAGFALADGRRITLLNHWNGNGPEAAFLRAVRDGLCDWFNVTLGPDYNALHADHFHVDMGPYLTCR